MWCFKKYKAIAYLPTTYALLQYYLLEPYEVKETLFFINTTFPELISNRLSNVIPVRYISLYYHYLFLMKIHLYSFFNPKTPVYLGGNLPFADLFMKSFETVFYLEDGVGSYELVYNRERQVVKRNKSMLSRWLHGDRYPWYGLANNVRIIYLTGILPIPEIIANKVELIDLQLLWQQKNLSQKESILKVFLPEGIDKYMFVGYETLSLTQPFREDSGIHFLESDKIDVYRKLLSGYDESKVLIKVHPREKTDYSCYFPKARILKTPCPMELLTLMGLPVKRAISVNSTAIFNLGSSVEKIISGYDITPALAEEAKRRGLHDGISNRFTTK